MNKNRLDKNAQLPTTGHTQLPGCAVANVGSFAFLVGNPTRKRIETATAYTGGRWKQYKKSNYKVPILGIILYLCIDVIK